MDFHSLKRRDLQALCKKNNIPANMTNAAMADALKSLETVEGVEEFLGQLETGERSVITSPYAPRTSTRSKPSKAGLECSQLATRTHCGTRTAAEGTDTRKTPATRTTRRRATQDASVQKKMEKDLQAQFEDDLEESEASENNGLKSTETAEEASGLSVDEGGQNEPEKEMPESEIDGGEIVDLVGDKENLEEQLLSEVGDESIKTSNSQQKVDFHNLGRKDLQHLCKKNKIPANMTNAAMADALESLVTVEGLEEFLEGYDPLAIKSPESSRMTSSRVHQTRTGRRTTERKSLRAASARKTQVEGAGCPVTICNDQDEVDRNLQSCLEACIDKSEFVDHVPESSSTINCELRSASEEFPNEPEISVDKQETRKELLNELVENTDNDSRIALGQEYSNLSESEGKTQDIASENQRFKIHHSKDSGLPQMVKTDSNSSDETNVDKSLRQKILDAEIEGLDQCINSDNSLVTETLESDSCTFDEPDDKGLMLDVPAPRVDGFGQSSEFSLSEAENGEGAEQLINTENQEQLTDFVKDASTEEDLSVSEDIDSLVKDASDTTSEESNIIEDSKSTAKDDADPKSETDSDVADPTLKVNIGRTAHCGTEDQYPNSGSVNLECSDAVQEANRTDKIQVDDIEGPLAKHIVSESAADGSQHAPAPLYHKSLRKLKKMLKEKLHDANLLANKMERLTLEDDADHNNSDADLAKEAITGPREVNAKTEETFGVLDPTMASGSHDAVTCALAEGEKDDESNDGLEISDCSLTSQFNVDDDATEVDEEQSEKPTAVKQEPDAINSPLQFTTPSKSSRKTTKLCVVTPGKSSCKKPISAGRKSCVSDGNKENIVDSAASKTEPGKMKVAVASAISMGMLKKGVKELLQQSEKKRPALQSRPDNQFPLASP